MLHTYESVDGPYRDTTNRAHGERAKATSAMLAGAARGLGRAGRFIVSGVLTARRRRAAIRQLNTLDERMLKDIGISRGEIQYLVDQMLSAERAATGELTGQGEIAVFPDRKATNPSADEPVRRAA